MNDLQMAKERERQFEGEELVWCSARPAFSGSACPPALQAHACKLLCLMCDCLVLPASCFSADRNAPRLPLAQSGENARA